MITGNDYGRKDEDLEARLERIERKLERSQQGGGGLGCCGFVMLAWVIYLLYQILGKLS